MGFVQAWLSKFLETIGWTLAMLRPLKLDQQSATLAIDFSLFFFFFRWYSAWLANTGLGHGQALLECFEPAEFQESNKLRPYRRV